MHRVISITSEINMQYQISIWLCYVRYITYMYYTFSKCAFYCWQLYFKYIKCIVTLGKYMHVNHSSHDTTNGIEKGGWGDATFNNISDKKNVYCVSLHSFELCMSLLRLLVFFFFGIQCTRCRQLQDYNGFSDV